jgi:ATP-dependent Clp protease ATP-binding subunit ClpA
MLLIFYRTAVRKKIDMVTIPTDATGSSAPNNPVTTNMSFKEIKPVKGARQEKESALNILSTRTKNQVPCTGGAI